MTERNRDRVHRILRTRVGWLLQIYFVCTFCATPAHGVAQASQEQRGSGCSENQPYQSLVDTGLEAFHASKFELARECFVHAHAQLGSARTLRALGMVDLALDNYSLARQELDGALVHPDNPLTEEQRREVNELLDWMRNSLGILRLEYQPRMAIAAVDDKPIAPGDLMLELGEHQLRIEAPGYRPYRKRFGIAAGQPPLRLEIVLTQEPPPVEIETSNAWLWVGGASAVALAVGGTLSVIGQNALAKVRTMDPGAHQNVDDGIALRQSGRTLTRAGFAIAGVGVLGLVGALVLRLAQDRSSRQPERNMTYELGFGRFDLQGRF